MIDTNIFAELCRKQAEFEKNPKRKKAFEEAAEAVEKRKGGE